MPPRASSSTTNRPTNAKKKSVRFPNTAPPNPDPGDVEILKSVQGDQVKIQALLLNLKAQQEAKIEQRKLREKEEAAIEAQAALEQNQQVAAGVEAVDVRAKAIPKRRKKTPSVGRKEPVGVEQVGVVAGVDIEMGHSDGPVIRDLEGPGETVAEPERRDVEPEEGGPQYPIKAPQPEELATNTSSMDKEDSDAVPPAPQIRMDQKGKGIVPKKRRLPGRSAQRQRTKCSLTVTEDPSAFDLAQMIYQLMEKVERNTAKSYSLHAEVVALRADLLAIRSENMGILKAFNEVSNVVGHILDNTQAHEEDSDEDAAEVEHAMLE